MKKKNQSTPTPISSPSWLSNTKNQCLIVISLGLLIYLNTLNHGFVLDDEAVISKNKFVQQGISGWGDILSTFYWKGYWNENSGLFRPFSLLMFSVEWQLSPGNPFVHHVVNVLVYGVLIWALFSWLNELVGEKYRLVPFVATLLFAAHPMHTEVVANIKSRDELLALTFFLLSAYLFLQELKESSLFRRITAPFLFLLALLSKEGSLLFLPIFFLSAWMLLGVKWQVALKRLLPFAVVAMVWGLWYYMVIALSPDKILPYSYLDNSLVSAPDALHRFATATTLVGKYLYKVLVPFSFSYDYSFNDIPVVGLGSLKFLVSALLVAGLFFLAARVFKKNPYITFSILFFFITLSLASNVFKLIGITFAERLLFTPSVGFCLLLALLLNMLFNPRKEALNNVVLMITIGICLVYSITAIRRNKDWKSNLSLYAKDSKANSNSARIYYNYASILLNEVVPAADDEQRRSGYLTDVVNLLEKSIQIDPAYSSSYINLGVAYYKIKNYKASIAATRQALQRMPEDPGVMTNLGDAYFKAGMYDSSIFYHQKCVDRKYIRKETYNFLGTAFFNKKQYDEAGKYYKAGIQNDSTYAGLWLNYGNVLGLTKQYEEAIRAFDTAYRLDPSNPQPLSYKALTYYNMGDMTNAQKWDLEYRKRK